MAGETAALHVEIERLTAERDALRAELTALRVQETAASGGRSLWVNGRKVTPSDGWPDTDAERASATTSPNAKVSGAGTASAGLPG